MTYRRVLWRVEIAAVAALLVSSALLASGAFAHAAWWDSYTQASLIDAPSTFHLMLVYAVMFGAGPVVLVGAPAYAWLIQKRRASWPRALGLGAAPGFVVVLWSEPDLGAWVTVGGALAAALTHALSMRFMAEGSGLAGSQEMTLGS